MIRLFIEDQELDVAQDFQQRITYAIDDLMNLDSKATSFTQTIILPGTAKNNALLGNIFEIANSNLTNDGANVGYNFNASRAAKASMQTHGLQLIKGVLRLLEIVRTGDTWEYEVAIFGELGGLVAAMGNKRLTDLNFNIYNQGYTVTGITNSWAAAGAGSGVFYPLIDYGNVSTNKSDYQYRSMRPAFYVREYIDKILTEAGYTYDSTFFDTPFFKRLIIPQNQRNFFSEASNFFTGDRTTPQLLVTSVTGPIYTSSPVLFDTGYIKNFTLGTGTFTNTSGVALTVNVSFNCTLNYYSQNRDMFFVGFVNGSNAGTFGTVPATGNTTPASRSFSFSKEFTIPIGGTFSVRLVHPNDGTTQFFDAVVNFRSLQINSTIPVVSLIQINDLINMNDVIPKGIFQRDFFSSILKMFYLLVTEDKFTEKHLRIEPYVNFYTGEVLDWSDKLDRSSAIRIKPMSEINARYYNLKYKQDSDFYGEEYRKKYNEGYGDRIYDNGLEFARDTESVEIIFSSSVLYGTSGEDKVVPAIYKKSNAGAAEDSFEHNIRIMQCKRITGVNSWDVLDNTTVLASLTEYGYAGHLNDPDAPTSDINFGAPKEFFFEITTGDISANLFNAYYSPYFAEITEKDSRLLTGKFRLTDQDIFDLDFAKFIYIDGALFRLSKVSDYVPGGNELTEVQLLRVINTDY
jgi:hypothetical protein